MKTRSSAEYYVLSILYFFIAKLLIKTIPGIPSFEIVFFRAVISSLICFYVLKKNGIPLIGSNKTDLFLRGIFGTAAMLSFFYTLQHVPLATATALVNVSPIFTILFASLFLKEKTTFVQWILFFMALLGVFVLKGFDTSISFKNLMIGLSSAAFSGIAYNFIRRIKDRENPYVIVFSLSFIAIPVFFPLVLMRWKTPNLFEFAILLSIGLLIQIAQVYLTRAHQTSSTASSIMHYTYLDVVISTIAGYFLFHEACTMQTVVGILIIIASVYLIRRTNQKAAVTTSTG